MKVRHPVHILLGIALPWLSPAVNIGGVIFFCGYQYLQYRYKSTRKLRDDSYLDIKETVIPYIISAIIFKLWGML
jgi:hypothetical protein